MTKRKTTKHLGLPWWLSGKEYAWDAGNTHSVPGSARSPGGGNSHTLQYSCLESSMDRGAWRTTVHGVSKSRTWLKTLNKNNETQTNKKNNETFDVMLLTEKYTYSILWGSPPKQWCFITGHFVNDKGEITCNWIVSDITWQLRSPSIRVRPTFLETGGKSRVRASRRSGSCGSGRPREALVLEPL